MTSIRQFRTIVTVDTVLDGESLDEKELEEILGSSGGLVLLRGKWVEVDRDKLAEALTHWKQVERQTRDGGLTSLKECA